MYILACVFSFILAILTLATSDVEAARVLGGIGWFIMALAIGVDGASETN